MENVQATKTEESNILRKFSRELAVALNDHELQTYGKMLAEKVREEELAEEKKKQVNAEHTNRIKAIRVEIKRIADARAKGEELRPVQCAERLANNVIEIVRLDRNEVVDTRPADLRDLQANLPHVPEMPPDFDEGPRGDDMGGPDKTGRAIDPRVQDTPAPPGEMVESSSGDQVFAGAPDDVDDTTLICDACATVIGPDDRTMQLEGSTIHVDCAPDDSTPDAPADEDEMIDRKLAERESSNVIDGDFGGALARKATAEKLKAEADAAELDRKLAEQKSAGRDRSRKSNEAKGTSKSAGKPKRKR